MYVYLLLNVFLDDLLFLFKFLILKFFMLRNMRILYGTPWYAQVLLVLKSCPYILIF